MKYCGLTGLIFFYSRRKRCAIGLSKKVDAICGESCVDDNNIWCNSENDRDCSCKKGCLIFDRLLNPKDSASIYCRTCFCSEISRDGRPWCSKTMWCKPEEKTLYVDYPNENGVNPPCINADNE